MATVFIKLVAKLSGGEVILTAMVIEGAPRDSMKLNVEARTAEIERMVARSIQLGAGPRGVSVMQTNWLKEAKEKQVLQIMVNGADFATLKKYEGKNVEFS